MPTTPGMPTMPMMPGMPGMPGITCDQLMDIMRRMNCPMNGNGTNAPRPIVPPENGTAAPPQNNAPATQPRTTPTTQPRSKK